MALTKKYSHPPTAIATYDFTDIAENTGIVHFFGSASTNEDGTEYFLTSNAGYADPNETAVVTTVKAYEFKLSPFALPQTIEGTGYVDFSFTGSAATILKFLLIKDSGKDVTTTDTVEFAAADGTSLDFTYTVDVLADNVFISKLNTFGAAGASEATITISKGGNVVAKQITSAGTTNKVFTFTDTDFSEFFDTGDTMSINITCAANISTVAAQTVAGTLASVTNQTTHSGFARNIIFTQVKNYDTIVDSGWTNSVTADTEGVMRLVVPFTQFKKGEIMTLKAAIFGTNAQIACNPTNGDTTSFVSATTHTSLNLYVPFNLDL